MNCTKTIFAAICAATLAALAGEEYPELPRNITDETPEQRSARMAWWIHDRFGMFIHFGLYAVPARHEWVKSKEAISDAVYDSKYLPRFNPDLFDAREWASAAKAAGMKYAVLTTKHHEGFCMWDTATTDYKITKTDFRRDLVREYVDACREAGLKVGFYFSIKDWHHPDYIVDRTHPQFRQLVNGGMKGEELSAAVAKLNEGRDWERYRKYMYDQVRELLTKYGKIDIIWFDYTVKDKEYGKTYKSWDAVRLVKETRELQPGIPPRPDGHRRRLGLRYARAVQGADVADDPRQEGAVGDLPDVLGQLGLLPRRGHVEERAAAYRAARAFRLQGRQPDHERGADRARRVRLARQGAA